MGLLTDYLHKDLPLDIESVFKGATCLRNLQHTLGTTCQGLNRLVTFCCRCCWSWLFAHDFCKRPFALTYLTDSEVPGFWYLWLPQACKQVQSSNVALHERATYLPTYLASSLNSSWQTYCYCWGVWLWREVWWEGCEFFGLIILITSLLWLVSPNLCRKKHIIIENDMCVLHFWLYLWLFSLLIFKTLRACDPQWNWPHTLESGDTGQGVWPSNQSTLQQVTGTELPQQ